MINKLKMDMTIDSWFEEDDPAKIALDNFRHQFGSDDGLYIVYQPKDGDVFSYRSLQLIDELSKELKYPEGITGLSDSNNLGHIDKVTSLTNSRYQIARGDDLISRKMVSVSVPEGKEELEKLRQIASTQESMQGALFSSDFAYGALMIKTDFGAIVKGDIPEESPGTGSLDEDEFEIGEDVSFEEGESITSEKVDFIDTEISEYVDFMTDFRTVINQPKYRDHFEFYPVGNPAMMDFAMRSTEEAGILMVLMLVIIVGLLWSLLRSFSAVVWPVVLIIVNVCWTIGGAAWLGIEVSTLVSLTAMLMITVGVADEVHVMSTYLLYRRKGLSHEASMTKTYRKTGIPILITSLTTMGGMFALCATGMPQFVVFGAMSAIGVGMAWFLTWTLLPACLDLWHPLKKGAPVKEQSKQSKIAWLISAGWIQPLLDKIPSIVSPRPSVFVVLFVFVLGIFTYGTMQVKIDSNMVELTEEGSELRIAYELVDKKMSGAQNMEVMLEFGERDALKDPEVLKAMDNLEQLLAMNYSEYVTKSFSLSKMTKETNQLMNQGRREFYRIPDDPQLASQLIFLFGNANPEDRRLLVDDNFSKTHISVMLKNAGSYEYKEMFTNLTKDIDLIFDPLKGKYPELRVVVTGSLAMIMRLSQDMAENQRDSFLLAIAIISIFMIFTLGSLQGGLISIIPNVLPAVFTFGMMGLLGVPLDGDTMVIAPLIIGIAVDDTIHFITHYRDALMEGMDINTAVMDTLKEVGQAITFTSLILGLGFAVLTFSAYGGLSKMGMFGSMGIFVALLSDLFLLPAMIYLFKPTMGIKVNQSNVDLEVAPIAGGL
ncbi:MAG: MMPL family transporter [Proteobacteria bacterium]|nr:MMPL family transporter [Pseudomonadota bacterium]